MNANDMMTLAVVEAIKNLRAVSWIALSTGEKIRNKKQESRNKNMDENKKQALLTRAKSMLEDAKVEKEEIMECGDLEDRYNAIVKVGELERVVNRVEIGFYDKRLDFVEYYLNKIENW